MIKSLDRAMLHPRAVIMYEMCCSGAVTHIKGSSYYIEAVVQFCPALLEYRGELLGELSLEYGVHASQTL